MASWLRGGVVGQPQYDPVTKEIRASHKTTSDVTQQASLADILSIYLYLSYKSWVFPRLLVNGMQSIPRESNDKDVALSSSNMAAMT